MANKGLEDVRAGSLQEMAGHVLAAKHCLTKKPRQLKSLTKMLCAELHDVCRSNNGLDDL
jgi:hypothetical protein